MMRILVPMSLLLLALPGQLAGQAGERDTGRLVVRRADAVVGEEEFSLDVMRDADGGTTITLVVSASYPAEGARRAAATFGTRRITVRISGGGTEVAREYPRTGPDLVLHDGLLGLLVIAGQFDAGPVTLFTPPSASRSSGRLENLGQERLVPGGPTVRHVVVRGGAADIDLWFDGPKLMRLAIPDRGIVADRMAAARP
jgi:hypothetical protein